MTRRQLAAYLFVVAMCAYGLFQVHNVQEDLRSEIDSDAVRACRRAIETRQEQEIGLVQVVTELGGRPEVIDTIHDVYRRLPEPVTCDGG